MAKTKRPSELLKLAMTLSILAALPISVMAFNSLSNTQRSGAAGNSVNVLSGAHYNLEVVGVPNGKTNPSFVFSGNRLYIKTDTQLQLDLGAGEFAVVDGNGTDGRAVFQLPNPDPDSDGVTDYSLWVLTLNKPGGNTSSTPCTRDPSTDNLYCNVYQLVSVKGNQSNLSDVYRDLLFVYIDLNTDGKSERYSVFDDSLQGYFWDFDSQGNKIAKLRLYEMPSSTD